MRELRSHYETRSLAFEVEPGLDWSVSILSRNSAIQSHLRIFVKDVQPPRDREREAVVD
jgi:hypothetical protein